MGIAGFYLWLERWYPDCVVDIPNLPPMEHGVKPQKSDAEILRDTPRCDNLYLDMNGLIHPCCHDTAPLPEPESEEEMFHRIFEQMETLVRVARPRKALVLCIDGVAPRSKMNQQRTRRFRAADERLENNQIAAECADYIVKEHMLPRPTIREKWDHNVITPSTAFMERVGQAIEWFVMKKLNECDEWKNLTVVFSDAHVPGEGEHKIMHYIRGLRAQPGYDSNTVHCIHGMDADLICLGLSTHEPNFVILRNKLNETFQPTRNEFCFFDLKRYRSYLEKDFSDIDGMDFERVIDDFIFLCFFVGNDFLPHMPLISIKTKGIETLLDHYVKQFDHHGYLTRKGEVNFERLRGFLRSFVATKLNLLRKEYNGKKHAAVRAQANVKDRTEKQEQEIAFILESLGPSATEEARLAASNQVLGLYSGIRKERARLVVGREELNFSYQNPNDRDKYYQAKFGWDPANRKDFEERVGECCAEFFRGMQWVMRYYTKGCPSWSWYYKYHYTPLLEDLAAYNGPIDVEMRIGEPLHPVEQLLAVLPRQSVAALPEELHEAVEDHTSVLAKFYPSSYHVDFSEANFSYQGVAQLPFINCNKLKKAITEVVILEPDEGTNLVFCHNKSTLMAAVEKVLATSGGAGGGGKDSANVMAPIPPATTLQVCPIAGRIGRYVNAWPVGGRIRCPDSGIAAYPGTAFAKDISVNQVQCYSYELNMHADYNPVLLGKYGKAKKSSGSDVSKKRDRSPAAQGDSHHRSERADRKDSKRDRSRRREKSRGREEKRRRSHSPRDGEKRKKRSRDESSSTTERKQYTAPDERKSKRARKEDLSVPILDSPILQTPVAPTHGKYKAPTSLDEF